MTRKTEMEARALVLQLGAEQSASSRRRALLLIEAGYGTIQKLRDATDKELEAIPDIGPVAIKQLRALIAAL